MSSAFILIVAMLAAGQLCARLRAFPDNAADTLNRFVIYVCLPALVLKHVPKLHWDPKLYVLALAPWLVLGASVALVLLAARIFHFSKGVLGALLLCVPLGNTSFLGFPMVAALVNDDAVQYAVIYDQLGSFLIVSIYGSYVLARFSGGAAPSAGNLALRIVKFPPFIGLMLALTPLATLPVLVPLITRIGDTLVPLAMFAVGLRLQLRPSALTEWPALLFGLCVKMVVAPLLVLLLTRVLGTEGDLASVAVLEAAMPPMITAGALASMAGFAPELSVALVGFGLLLSLVWLPLVASW